MNLQKRNSKVILFILAALLLFLVVAGISALVSNYYVSKNIQVEQPGETNLIRQGPGRGRMAYFIKNELNLDEEQYRKLQVSMEKNENRYGKLFFRLDSIRNEIFSELSGNNPDREKLNELAYEYGVLTEKHRLYMIEHFLELKDICQPHQYPAYKKLLEDLQQRGPDNKFRKRRHRVRHEHGWRRRFWETEDRRRKSGD